MSRGIKFFIIFALLLFLFVGYRTYQHYNDIKHIEKLILLQKSKSLAAFISAFRQTYQDAFIHNKIAINDQTLNLLPVKTISEISERFALNVNEEIIIRTVSDRPRNSQNMANDFELTMINYFNNNTNITDKFIQFEESYHYVKPLYIKESCLKCHGKRENAIPSIRDRYANAYDYKMGDIRGLLNIKIKKTKDFTTLYKDFKTNLFVTLFLYVLFLVIIYALIKRMKKREDEYTQQLEIDIQKNMKEIEEQKEILYDQAHHDSLTGLPNRTLFNAKLADAINIAKRNKSILALFFIDLDYFKQINDSLGHDIGDKVLIEVSKRLQNAIRKGDTLARLGGDEFTVIMENIRHADDASILAEKLQNVFKHSIDIENHTFYITSSIGIVLYPDDCTEPENLIKYADIAMYKAKDEGRNTIQFYASELSELALKKMHLKTNLREALNHNEFSVYYQLQVDALTDKIIGLEALVRWNHPTKGLMFPADFIKSAKETGIIVELDKWVMKTAMQQVVTWHEKGLITGILALNLSIRYLNHDDFIDELSTCIKELNFNPKWLELEIEEEQVMNKPNESIVKLEQINKMGISLAIDDFGTGYSSLTYLKRLPVKKLKIDKSFIQGIPNDADDVVIVKAIIALAKSLNLDIIAEGVETAEQKAFLIEHGCRLIQGYYYHKPLPVDQIEKILQTN